MIGCACLARMLAAILLAISWSDGAVEHDARSRQSAARSVVTDLVANSCMNLFSQTKQEVNKTSVNKQGRLSVGMACCERFL